MCESICSFSLLLICTFFGDMFTISAGADSQTKPSSNVPEHQGKKQRSAFTHSFSGRPSPSNWCQDILSLTHHFVCTLNTLSWVELTVYVETHKFCEVNVVQIESCPGGLRLGVSPTRCACRIQTSHQQDKLLYYTATPNPDLVKSAETVLFTNFQCCELLCSIPLGC